MYEMDDYIVGLFQSLADVITDEMREMVDEIIEETRRQEEMLKKAQENVAYLFLNSNYVITPDIVQTFDSFKQFCTDRDLEQQAYLKAIITCSVHKKYTKPESYPEYKYPLNYKNEKKVNRHLPYERHIPSLI